jgi:basic amino acid/polyamine antiporter, APA family
VQLRSTTVDRPIGFWISVALVVGNMIGAGVFLLPASLAPYRGVSVIGWLISAVGSICLALAFARLSAFRPASGGPYAYTRLAYGDLAGFLVGWGYCISIWSANAALAVAFVAYLDPFLPSLVRNPVSAAVAAVALVWLLTAVNCWGTLVAGRVQVVTTALKTVPLLIIGVAGLFSFDPSLLSMAAPVEGGMARNILATVTLTLWAFLGLECATIPAGATAEAERTIPRATVIGTIVTAAIYIVATLGVMSLLDAATLATSTAPFADAARLLAGDGAAALVALGAATSCLGALNGWVLISGQIPMAIANDGLFPRPFARISARGTPAFAMVVGAVLSTALVAMNYTRGLVELFTFIILLATLSSLVPYAFCSLAGFILHRRDAAMSWSTGAAVVSALAFVYALFAIGGAGADVVFYGFLLLMSGLPVYVWISR